MIYFIVIIVFSSIFILLKCQFETNLYIKKKEKENEECEFMWAGIKYITELEFKLLLKIN